MDRGKDQGKVDSCAFTPAALDIYIRKMLERMPLIQVFVGLDAVRASAEEVPGLPTRAELKQWTEEHDRIEKETEIFDSGELRKLKKFTKGVSLRLANLQGG